MQLTTTGQQIAQIKDAHFVTMSDYISAYAQIEHLQNDYDQQVERYADLYNLAHERVANRGLI